MATIKAKMKGLRAPKTVRAENLIKGNIYSVNKYIPNNPTTIVERVIKFFKSFFNSLSKFSPHFI